MRKDLTKRQFDAALKRRNIKPDHFGYFEIKEGFLVHIIGKQSFREKLARLIHLQKEYE